MAHAHLNAPLHDGASEFVQFWNEVLGPKINRFRHILAGGLTRHSEAVFPILPVREGDRVVDVGCGWGDTAMELARMVGPTGSVTGIDCCDLCLDIARGELAEAGLDNVTFLRGDAEVALPEGAFDFAFARFGTMFFANPVAGLRNMRRSLRPGGRMVASSGAIPGTVAGCRWPRRWCCASCRRRAKGRGPACQARSRWPTSRRCPR